MKREPRNWESFQVMSPILRANSKIGGTRYSFHREADKDTLFGTISAYK